MGKHYDYFYTDKDPLNFEKLNIYELQHALYDAYADYDSGKDKDEALRADGRQRLIAIQEEYERRGFSGIVRKEFPV